MKKLENHYDVFELLNLLYDYIIKNKGDNLFNRSDSFLNVLKSKGLISVEEKENIRRFYKANAALYSESNIIYYNLINELYNKHVNGQNNNI